MTCAHTVPQATSFSTYKIGSITTAGVIKEFSLPDSGEPQSIMVGPDGNLWFTERYADQIGRITITGHVTEFPIPNETGAQLEPVYITRGPGSALWFTELYAGMIGKITTK